LIAAHGFVSVSI